MAFLDACLRRVEEDRWFLTDHGGHVADVAGAERDA
jgi:hypothetical protein